MDGVMLVLAIVVPVCGALAAFAAGGRWAERIAFVSLAIGLAIAATIAVTVSQSGGPLLTGSAAGHRRSAWGCAPTDFPP